MNNWNGSDLLLVTNMITLLQTWSIIQYAWFCEHKEVKSLISKPFSGLHKEKQNRYTKLFNKGISARFMTNIFEKTKQHFL